MINPWLLRPRADPAPELRLFCIPYAGGASSIYRRWSELVPSRVEVCTVELPGRGSRMGEAPFLRLTPLVRALAQAVEPLLDRPFALFGHSMGGLIAFELTRWLRRRGGPAPLRLFVSATSAPGTPPSLPLIHLASDADVKSKMRSLNGTPQELLDNDELMQLMIPILRADFSVLETHEHREEPPLDVPISVFGGARDRAVRPSALDGWRDQSAVETRLRLLPGDHFFIHGAAVEIVADILKDLGLEHRPGRATPAAHLPRWPGAAPAGAGHGVPGRAAGAGHARARELQHGEGARVDRGGPARDLVLASDRPAAARIERGGNG